MDAYTKDLPHVRRWCSGIMQDSHSCDPGSIPGRRKSIFGACSTCRVWVTPGGDLERFVCLIRWLMKRFQDLSMHSTRRDFRWTPHRGDEGEKQKQASYAAGSGRTTRTATRPSTPPTRPSAPGNSYFCCRRCLTSRRRYNGDCHRQTCTIWTAALASFLRRMIRGGKIVTGLHLSSSFGWFPITHQKIFCLWYCSHSAKKTHKKNLRNLFVYIFKILI